VGSREGPAAHRELGGTRRSDYASFWDLGSPAIMITDAANVRNPHYDRKSDRVDTLDLTFLASVCQGLFEGRSTL
jgi:hypothetical protein